MTGKLTFSSAAIFWTKKMNDTVFLELEFVLLVAASIVAPTIIYGYLFKTKAISRAVILSFALILIALSGTDIFLLKRLAIMAKATSSIHDDWLFTSELSMALYLLPAVFAGIAVNLLSHLLIGHLAVAEKKFDQEHQRSVK